jgi:hypothetical protein
MRMNFGMGKQLWDAEGNLHELANWGELVQGELVVVKECFEEVCKRVPDGSGQCMLTTINQPGLLAKKSAM